jgi:hypothetical protein
MLLCDSGIYPFLGQKASDDVGDSEADISLRKQGKLRDRITSPSAEVKITVISTYLTHSTHKLINFAQTMSRRMDQTFIATFPISTIGTTSMRALSRAFPSMPFSACATFAPLIISPR